jgi:hypothetical protein
MKNLRRTIDVIRIILFTLLLCVIKYLIPDRAFKTREWMREIPFEEGLFHKEDKK